MTTKYQADIDATYEELKEAGVLMTIKRSSTTVDPATGMPTTVDSEESSYGYFKYKDVQSSGEGFMNGTLIESADKFIMLAAKGLTQNPEEGDKITVGDDTYRVKNNNPMEPDGVPIYHMLHVGK